MRTYAQAIFVSVGTQLLKHFGWLASSCDGARSGHRKRVSLRMYVCTYVRTLYVHTYVRTYVHTYVRYTRTYVRKYICTYIAILIYLLVDTQKRALTSSPVYFTTVALF